MPLHRGIIHATRHIAQQVDNSGVPPCDSQHPSFHPLQTVATLQLLDSKTRFLHVFGKADTVGIDSSTRQSVPFHQLCHQLDTGVVIVSEESVTLVQVVLADIQHRLCCLPYTSVLPFANVWQQVQNIPSLGFGNGEQLDSPLHGFDFYVLFDAESSLELQRRLIDGQFATWVVGSTSRTRLLM